MILDRALFDATSRGSAVKIRCRCDVCGEEKLMIKQKLVQRGDSYERCRSCYYVRNGALSRAMVEAACVDCGKKSKRRADALKLWSGRCQSCASKENASRPEMKRVLRENGLRTPPPVRKGAESHMWRGGLTPENMRVRGSIQIKNWRDNVFARDDYTCTCCGARGGKLEADHIMPFSLYPELRFSVFNGRTMCKSCHGALGAKVLRGKQIREARFPQNQIWRIG